MERIFKLSRVPREGKLITVDRKNLLSFYKNEILMPSDWHFEVNHSAEILLVHLSFLWRYTAILQIFETKKTPK